MSLLQTRTFDFEPVEMQLKDGDVYLRMYGVTDNVLTQWKWLLQNSDVHKDTLKGQPVVDYDRHPEVHNPKKLYTNLEKWRKDSAAVAVGVIEEIDWNTKSLSHDVIWKVTDPKYKEICIDCLNNKKALPWNFSSPGIWGNKIKRDPESGIRIYEDWTGVHIAIMKDNPGFPREIAQINENVCIGGINCAQELAAVAVGIIDENSKNFTFDISEKPGNFDNMPNDTEGKNGQPDSYEKYIGLISEKDAQIKALTDKVDAAAKATEDVNNKLKTVTTERDDYKSKEEARVKADKEKFFQERFGKIFTNEDEVKEKVAYALEKNLTEDEFTKLWGSMYDQAIEAEKAESEGKNAQDNAGVAAGRERDPVDNYIADNVDTALGIALMRKRVI